MFLRKSNIRLGVVVELVRQLGIEPVPGDCRMTELLTSLSLLGYLYMEGQIRVVLI